MIDLALWRCSRMTPRSCKPVNSLEAPVLLRGETASAWSPSTANTTPLIHIPLPRLIPSYSSSEKTSTSVLQTRRVRVLYLSRNDHISTHSYHLRGELSTLERSPIVPTGVSITEPERTTDHDPTDLYNAITTAERTSC
jgi:hypothetical protein